MRIDDDRLSEWERMSNAATAGPWKWEDHGLGEALYSGRDDNHHGLNLLSVQTRPPVESRVDANWRQNADFISVARDAVPELVAEVRRLRRFFKAYCDFMRATDAEEHRDAARELREAQEACE